MAVVTVVLVLALALGTWQVEASSSFFADNDRGQSIPMGKMPRHERKNVQQDLLELMGLYSKPKPKANKKITQSASKFMRDVYESLKDLDGPGQFAEDSHIHISRSINASILGLDPVKLEGADVIVSFVNYARKQAHLRHAKDKTFYFDFSEVSVGEEVRGADLRIYKEVTFAPKLKGRRFTLNLYSIKLEDGWENKFTESESSLHANGRTELESSRRVNWDTEGWITLDATKSAENWTIFPKLNGGLLLEVTDEYGNEYHPRDIGIVGRRGPADKQSFLVGYMDVSPQVLSRRARSVRARRWTGPDGESYSDNPYTEYSRNGYVHYRSHNNCQKHNLYINFRDIGFDSEFLIAPEGYSAYYCAGDCSFPLGIHQNATNHAIVQTLVHLMSPADVPKPCCAPTKFGTITLLYYDDNTSVVLQRFRDMIVRACGCH